MSKSFNVAQKHIDSYEAFQEVVESANINKTSLLATDYLNHFNEVIMIMDMISDMPECIEDVAAWTPKSYQEHFLGSTFTHKDLAVAAYDYVPPRYRQPFERIVGQLNELILNVAGRLTKATASGDTAEVARTALFMPELRLLVERAGAIINGEENGHDQDDIDAVLRG